MMQVQTQSIVATQLSRGKNAKAFLRSRHEESRGLLLLNRARNGFVLSYWRFPKILQCCRCVYVPKPTPAIPSSVCPANCRWWCKEELASRQKGMEKTKKPSQLQCACFWPWLYVRNREQSGADVRQPWWMEGSQRRTNQLKKQEAKATMSPPLPSSFLPSSCLTMYCTVDVNSPCLKNQPWIF